MRIETRPATAADIEQFYGCRPGVSIRALAFLAQGELVGIAGVTLEHGQLFAFSDIKPGVTAPKKTVWRCARIAMEFITRTNAPLLAVASGNYPNAPRLLERLGFRHAFTDATGEIYRWPN